MNKITLSLIAASAMTSISSYGALVPNGDFELPALAQHTWNGTYQSIPGWIKDYGYGIEIQNNVAGAPYSPQQFVELDSYSNSGMVSDIIATTPGTQYDLSFAYSPRPGVAANSNGILVYFNGTEIGNITADGSGLSNTQWSMKHFTVTATGTGSTIGFRADGLSDSLGGYLDNVSLAPVPEPSTYIAGISALGMLCLFGKRNRK